MLVSTTWLKDNLDDVVVLDASWHMPGTGRDAHAEYLACRIKGAQRFDIDVIADPESSLPHTLPTPEGFAQAVSAVGISNTTTVVVYEESRLFAAPRARWMFKVMGHDALILEGGLAAWREAGYPVETGEPAAPQTKGTFTAKRDPSILADADLVAEWLARGGQVADVRSPARFEGVEPEPRQGVRGGHMPGALNAHYASLLDDAGRLKGQDELRKVITQSGLDPAQPMIASCGSGVSAAILALALERVGGHARVYDGSWSEWGADLSRPVVTGKAGKP
ncbi:MAG: sulfurtransferase [Pseudomonadota bacterium]